MVLFLPQSIITLYKGILYYEAKKEMKIINVRLRRSILYLYLLTARLYLLKGNISRGKQIPLHFSHRYCFWQMLCLRWVLIGPKWWLNSTEEWWEKAMSITTPLATLNNHTKSVRFNWDTELNKIECAVVKWDLHLRFDFGASTINYNFLNHGETDIHLLKGCVLLQNTSF